MNLVIGCSLTEELGYIIIASSIQKNGLNAQIMVKCVRKFYSSSEGTLFIFPSCSDVDHRV